MVFCGRTHRKEYNDANFVTMSLQKVVKKNGNSGLFLYKKILVLTNFCEQNAVILDFLVVFEPLIISMLTILESTDAHFLTVSI